MPAEEKSDEPIFRVTKTITGPLPRTMSLALAFLRSTGTRQIILGDSQSQKLRRAPYVIKW